METFSPSQVGVVPVHSPGPSLEVQVLTVSPPDSPKPGLQLYVAIVMNSELSPENVMTPFVGSTSSGHITTKRDE